MFIGSNCCGCDDVAENLLRFDCNSVGDVAGEFSLDLSRVKVPFIGYTKTHLRLLPLQNAVIDSNYLIYESDNPISVYSKVLKAIEVNLKCSINSIDVKPYCIDLNYSLSSVPVDDYTNTMYNQKEFKSKYFSGIPETVYNFELSDDIKMISSTDAFVTNLITNKDRTINISPDDGFDLYSYEWEDSFIFKGIKYKLRLGIKQAGIYIIDSKDMNGDAYQYSSTFQNDFIDVKDFSVDASPSIYSDKLLKNTPSNMEYLKDADFVNSYFSLGLFGLMTKLSKSDFMMGATSSDILLVNESDRTVEMDLITLIF